MEIQLWSNFDLKDNAKNVKNVPAIHFAFDLSIVTYIFFASKQVVPLFLFAVSPAGWGGGVRGGGLGSVPVFYLFHCPFRGSR